MNKSVAKRNGPLFVRKALTDSTQRFSQRNRVSTFSLNERLFHTGENFLDLVVLRNVEMKVPKEE